jgi:hypothetical protein
MWEHILHLDAFAQGIRENTLDAIARDETNLVLGFDQQNAYAVVALISYAPSREQLISKIKNVIACNFIYCDNGNLSKASMSYVVTD